MSTFGIPSAGSVIDVDFLDSNIAFSPQDSAHIFGLYQVFVSGPPAGDTGTITISGGAPALFVKLPASPAGVVVHSGNIPLLGINIVGTTGDIHTTGNTPSVTQFTRSFIVPSTGSITATGYAPQLKISLLPTPSLLTSHGVAPHITKTLQGSIGSISIIGHVPTITVALWTQFTIPEAASVIDVDLLEGNFTEDDQAHILGLYGAETNATAFLDIPKAAFLSDVEWLDAPAAFGPADAGHLATVYRYDLLQGLTRIDLPTEIISVSGTVPSISRDLSVTQSTIQIIGNTPALPKTIIPTTGIIHTVGSVPGIAMSVMIGTISITGSRPILIRGIYPTTAQIAVIGDRSAQSLTLAPTPTTLSISGQPIADLTQNINYIPEDGAPIGISGGVPTLDLTIVGITGTVAIGGVPLEVGQIRSYDIQSGALILSGAEPSLHTGSIQETSIIQVSGGIPHLTLGLVPQTSHLTIAGATSTSATIVTPTTGPITATGGEPGIFWPIEPRMGQLSFISHPSTILSLSIVPSTSQVPLIGYAPEIISTIAPTSSTLVLLGNIPIIQQAHFIAPASADLTLRGSALSLLYALETSTGSLSLTGYEPPVSTGMLPAVGTIILTGYEPLVSQIILVNPSTNMIGVQGDLPTLSVELQPHVGAVILEGHAPGQLPVIGKHYHTHGIKLYRPRHTRVPKPHRRAA